MLYFWLNKTTVEAQNKKSKKLKSWAKNKKKA
jgi:hypothetical protein